MAFSSEAALSVCRTEYPDHTVITERRAGEEKPTVVWDSRSGLPDPDAAKPYVEAWWKEYDTPDGYSKNSVSSYGASKQMTPNGLKTIWDSRIDGIPQEWRDEEACRRAKYDQSVEYARRYNEKHGRTSSMQSYPGSSSCEVSSCSSASRGGSMKALDSALMAFETERKAPLYLPVKLTESADSHEKVHQSSCTSCTSGSCASCSAPFTSVAMSAVVDGPKAAASTVIDGSKLNVDESLERLRKAIADTDNGLNLNL